MLFCPCRVDYGLQAVDVVLQCVVVPSTVFQSVSVCVFACLLACVYADVSVCL